jgi:hypothetical protein
LNKKAQLFSVELLFAMGVFLLVLVASFSLWDVFQTRESQVIEISAMTLQAENMMNSLLLTSGSPVNWYDQSLDSEIVSVGLRGGGLYQIDSVKINGFEQGNSSYLNISKAMGVTKYNSYVELSNNDGILHKFGIDSSDDARNVVNLQRVAEMDREVVELLVRVWI